MLELATVTLVSIDVTPRYAKVRLDQGSLTARYSNTRLDRYHSLLR